MEKYFNDDWIFYKEGNESEKKSVCLPHDAMIFEKRDPKCENGHNTGFFPGGKYVYQKSFIADEELVEKYVAILFEGVYGRTKVYLNGEEIFSHAYGYTEFEVELEKLNIGEENTIKVFVDNGAEPNSRWYSGSGIYRPVTLIVKDKNYIKDVEIITKSYSPAIINVSCSDSAANVKIFDCEKLVAEGKCGDIEIKNAKLWSDESPYLYTAKIETPTDAAEVRFGIRKIEYSTKTGLLVNGKETLLRGACIHHDNGILGACAFADAEKRKVKIMKEAGFNAVRSAHNPCSRALLSACDEYGMYVMDEAFDGWYIPKTKNDYGLDFYDNYRSDLSAMVKKDVNHPSVIMYSVGNEVTETVSEKGIELSGEMANFVRNLDGSRPVTCGINLFLNGITSKGMGLYKEGDKNVSKKKIERQQKQLSGSAMFNMMMQRLGKIKNKVAKAQYADDATKGTYAKFDICGYNYGSVRYDMDGKKHPERVIVGSETYLPTLFDNWGKVKRLPYVIGDFIWTGWDYIGEAGIGIWDYYKLGYFKPYPMLLAGSGMIDICGEIGAEVYLARCAYGISDELKMAVLPLNHAKDTCVKSSWRATDAKESWAWNGYEGEKATVEVYSTDKKVRLYLNGKKVDSAKPKKGIATMKVPFCKGELKAVSFDKKGNRTGECVLRSAGNETRLFVEAEEKKIVADKQSLLYVNVKIVDENGVVRVLDDKKLTIKVEGAGVMQGFGSANPYTKEGFTENSHETFYGKAQAIIRSNGEKGEIKITVSANGLEDATIITEAV